MQTGLQEPVKYLLFTLKAVLRLASQLFLYVPISDLAACLLTSSMKELTLLHFCLLIWWPYPTALT